MNSTKLQNHIAVSHLLRSVLLPITIFVGQLIFVLQLPMTTQASNAVGRDPLESRVRTELSVFTNWLSSNHVRGYIGEVGWPNNSDTASWNSIADTWYKDADNANLSVSYWATGNWWCP